MRIIKESERSNAHSAESIINSCLVDCDSKNQKFIRKFIADSMKYASEKYPDRWGAILYGDCIRLDVGWVECLFMERNYLRILVKINSSRRDNEQYRYAPGCKTTKVPFSRAIEILSASKLNHRSAMDICSLRPTTRYIRGAHSVGLTNYLSNFTKEPILHPTYMPKFHILNGGFGNNDRYELEKAASSTRKVGTWVVPKSATIGDDVVINVASLGFYAIGKIASKTSPRRDWINRYGAKLGSIKLLKKSIMVEDLRAILPSLGWAKYPRSINTPTDELADQIRTLIHKNMSEEHNSTGQATEGLTLAELRSIATRKILKSKSKRSYSREVSSRNQSVKK